jgi:hypothetical protein
MITVLPGIEQRAGAPAEAYAKIEGIRARYPRSNDVARGYYQMLMFDKRYNDALVVANDALAAANDEQSMHWRKERAYLYQDMGRGQDACADVTWLVQRKPDVYSSMYETLECPEAFADLSPGKVREYVYGVEFNGTDYEFVVTPQAVDMDNGIRFKYAMTNASETSGSIFIPKASIDTSHTQMNMFGGGEQTLNTATTVWISKAVFREIKEKGVTEINASGEKKVFTINADDEAARNAFYNPGVTGPIDMIMVDEFAKKTKVIHLQSIDGREHIWINDDPANPLIYAMDLGWKIGLKEVRGK